MQGKGEGNRGRGLALRRKMCYNFMVCSFCGIAGRAPACQSCRKGMVPPLKEVLKTGSGAGIPCLSPDQAEARKYLSQETLDRMHLMPKGDPVAYVRLPSGEPLYYYDPMRVTEAPPESWYAPRKAAPVDPITLDSGKVIGRVNVRRAASLNLYPAERLAEMHYDIVAEPAAYMRKKEGRPVYLYDKREAIRQPKLCVECGKNVRYMRKLCRACFERDLAARRAEGDAHRAAHYGMKRERVLFFDLELTGVYDHDEIISISILDATGKVIMNTYVRPVHTKKWKKTEKIHGITPEMVADAPTLSELTPRIKEIFANADNLIAYGVSTDFSHIKMIYATEAERAALHEKVRCAAAEYTRFMQEHHPDLTHTSLSDAMACLGIEWDGVAHTSIADTIGCMKVWEALFPHYYED